MTQHDLTPNNADKRQQSDAILQQFRGAQVSQLHQAPVPRQLHHYTSRDGFTGILSSKSLWASDARYLNDFSELSYAIALIDEVVAEITAAVKDEPLRSALPKAVAQRFAYGPRPFVACFCEDGDLLSQWRGYVPGESGFSLGLDLSLSTIGARAGAYLRKVVYDEAVQREAVTEAVTAWLQTARSLLESDSGLTPKDLFPYPAIRALQEVLIEHYLCFKHPTFSEEREWRLIKLANLQEEVRNTRLRDARERYEELIATAQEHARAVGLEMPEVGRPWPEVNAERVKINFRPSRLGFVPYVTLPLEAAAGVFAGRLPLLQVTQGPTENSSLALEALEMYLESNGYGFPHTDIRASGIPLRR
ncbi:MAG: DUF2971 domain-containing protein [Solirubrobacteraceae bacterium]